MPSTAELIATLPAPFLANLQQADRRWSQLRQGPPAQIPTVVQDSTERLGTMDWDVVICGGTLGVMIGTTLALRGWRVLILERGILKGREQEWNISRAELSVLVELELLTEAQLETAIASEFNPNRIQFMGDLRFGFKMSSMLGLTPSFYWMR